MYELLAALEASAAAEWLRGLGVWTYGLLNLGHILGIASLFGAVILLDLRLLGVWQWIPVATIARPAVPVAAAGFVLAALSGTSMVLFNATEYHANPFFYIKFPVILAGLLNVALVARTGVWRRAVSGESAHEGDAGRLAVIGGVSLMVWLTVISCGRMIGYW